MPEAGHTTRFDTVVSQYERFRPDYPADLVRRITDEITNTGAATDTSVVDVGSGTGIFTRALRKMLAPDIQLIAVEPSDNMRNAAERTSGQAAGISWVKARAENIPLPSGSARAMTTATAAHWFDRPAFYAQATRLLVPSGLLAIVEYVRDTQHSSAAAALQDYLFSGTGGSAYTRPDYAAELQTLAGFGDVAIWQKTMTYSLTPARFTGLALSSSHSRPIVEHLGVATVTQQLEQIAESLKDMDGLISYGYVFQMYLTRRTD